jgi:hypothetical protein
MPDFSYPEWRLLPRPSLAAFKCPLTTLQATQQKAGYPKVPFYMTKYEFHLFLPSLVNGLILTQRIFLLQTFPKDLVIPPLDYPSPLRGSASAIILAYQAKLFIRDSVPIAIVTVCPATTY